MKRRHFIGAALTGAAWAQVPESIRNLKPMTGGVVPISAEERAQRIDKARRLMRENRLDAVLFEHGSSVFYYTGVRQPSSEAMAGWLLPAKGEPVWIVPAAEASRAPKGDVRTHANHDEAWRNIAQAIKGAASIGLEEQVRFFIYGALRKQMPATQFHLATPVTAGCRMIKSPAELALMQRANEITIEAYRAAFSLAKEGMTQADLRGYISAAHQALGARGGAMVAFGEYTAFPHGSITPQKLREGDFILVDGGCSLEGYQSDITRTFIFGKPTQRQRDVWALERKAQDAALKAARPGLPCEVVDAAARKVIVDAGFGPDYKVPGLPHRTGHGIGLDGHEWTNFVRGNKTPMAPGMCFSDEPMIAIYGEFGIRLEDCLYITESGARMFTRQSPSIDQPIA